MFSILLLVLRKANKNPFFKKKEKERNIFEGKTNDVTNGIRSLGATCTVCNVLHGWPRGQKNGQNRTTLPALKNNETAGYQDKGASLLESWSVDLFPGGVAWD